MERVKNIKDLAALAGVSAGTVSRALAGSVLISRATRERIVALADQHGYRPNQLARNLRIQRTGAIGVVMPLREDDGKRVDNPFFLSMLGLLADALTDHGYDLLLSRVAPGTPDWLDRFASSGRVDGLLLVGEQATAEEIDALAAQYRPMVAWGAQNGHRACTVGSDNRQGGAIAVEHLAGRGCRDIAFAGNPALAEMSERLEGARAAADKAGVKLRHLGSRDEFYAAFAGNDRPDGVFAGSDGLATNVLMGLAQVGLKVPDEVRVIGYDGIHLRNDGRNLLSTVDQRIEEGATIMVDLLLRRIAGEDTGSVMLEPRLALREST